MNAPKTKVCRGCKRRRPLTDFYAQAQGKHGRRAECKACGKAEREARGTTSATYARALRRLRDAYPRDFAAALAEERGRSWEPSFCPESGDYWRGRWADAASQLVDALRVADDGPRTGDEVTMSRETYEMLWWVNAHLWEITQRQEYEIDPSREVSARGDTEAWRSLLSFDLAPVLVEVPLLMAAALAGGAVTPDTRTCASCSHKRVEHKHHGIPNLPETWGRGWCHACDCASFVAEPDDSNEELFAPLMDESQP